MKRCSVCNQVKPLDDFYRDRRKQDGHAPRCKDCHRETYRETNKRYYRANRTKRLAYLAEYRKQNRERYRRLLQEWRAKNPERNRELNRLSRENNYEAYREREREREQVRRLAEGKPDADLAAFMTELLKLPCTYCGSADNVEIDHVVPLSRGGKHEAENLAPACLPCNRSKGAKLLDEWRVPTLFAA